MRKVGLALLAAAILPGAADAAPMLDIKGAAARIIIVPEARGDIQASLIRSSGQLPLRVRRAGQDLIIEGGLEQRVHGCPIRGGAPGVRIRGLGNLRGADLPTMVVRMPLDVRVRAGDGVTGTIGRARSVDLETRGCGAWTIANTSGRLHMSSVGSVDSHAGRAGAADLSVAGVGTLTTRGIAGPLTALSSGNGVISVESARGAVVIRVAGAGSVTVSGGKASSLNASIAGSGSARFGGEAGKVNASVTGPGRISVAKVTGPTVKRRFGSGEILLGR
jgi:hypothetical protein